MIFGLFCFVLSLQFWEKKKSDLIGIQNCDAEALELFI